MRHEQSADRRGGSATVLYLITSEVSSVFLRGQLEFMQVHGFRVVVGTRIDDPATTTRFDPGVEVFDLPLTRDPSPLRDLRGLFAVIRLIRKVRPDIVNASTPKAGLLGMLGAWLCRVSHRVYVVRGLRYESASGRSRTLLRGLERTAMRLATTVVFNSPSSRSIAELDGLLPTGRGQVLGAGSGNGIDTTRFDNRPPRDEARGALQLPATAPVIGFVGRLTRSKGITDLVAAFATVRDRVPGAQLLIVGDYEEGEPLTDEVRRAVDTDPDVLHLPWTSDVGSVYAALDVLAFPSFREGLPNVPLEAQLCEVPVVAYAATGTVDAVQHEVTGLLVPTGNQPELGSALTSLLVDPERGRELGRNGRTWVQAEFARERVWTALLEVYRTELGDT